MPKAQLVFTSHPNSFSVNIPNLEELSISQIKELELFVSQRKGMFDFSTYTFVIQKRIEFSEFVTLVRHSSIDALFQERIFVHKEQARVGFGQYKGMPYSEIPDSYLLWLKSNYRGPDKEFIDAELMRRKL